MTGLKPAKHGVFDFWEFDTASPAVKSKLVTHRKGGKAIWNILSEYGKRVVVMNVPLDVSARSGKRNHGQWINGAWYGCCFHLPTSL